MDLPVATGVGERKVANDGVRQIISLPCLHLAAEYGPLRSNSNNRLAWSCLTTSQRTEQAGRIGSGFEAHYRVIDIAAVAEYTPDRGNKDYA
jgi:hypothetical protein